MKTDKLENIYESIRNIYNQKEIISFIDNLISDKRLDSIQNSKIIHWLKHNFRNYLFREHTAETIINPEITEEWMNKVENKTFTLVNLDSKLYNQASHIIDYLTFEKNNQDLRRLSFHDALSQSIHWTDNQKSILDDLPGRTIHMDFEDDYSWVKLQSEQSIEYEGYQMNHCVAKNYKEGILNNKYSVYSLRDFNNIPHVTLLMNNETKIIEEIKGKSNHPVKLNYQYYLIELLNDLSFYHIKSTEYDNISNISFDKSTHEFVVFEDLQKNRASLYHHVEIPIKGKDKLKPYYHRPVSFDNFPLNSFGSTEFFHVSLSFKQHNFSHVSLIEKIKTKNLLIKNYFSHHASKVCFKNSFCEEFVLEHKKENNLIIQLELSNIKKIKLFTDEKTNNYFLKKEQKAFNFHELDFSLHSDMESIYLENAYIYNLKLPKNIKKLVLKNCKVDILDFSNTECETLVLDNTKLPGDIKCKNLVYNNPQLQNNIHCDMFMSSYSFSEDLFHNIGNVSLPNYQKIEKPELLKLSSNYFSPKSVLNLTEKYYPSYPEIPEIKLENYLTDRYSDFSYFNSQFRIFKFITTDFDDIHFIHDFLRDQLSLFVSNSFLKLEHYEMAQIITYHILNTGLNEVDMSIFENMFKNPLSQNVLNHISLLKENSLYATLKSVIPEHDTKNSSCLDDLEYTISFIHNKIQKFDEFTPYLKSKNYPLQFSLKEIDSYFNHLNSFEVLDKLNSQLDKTHQFFSFPENLFEKLYINLNIQDPHDFLPKISKVMDYSFIHDDFRAYALKKIAGDILLPSETAKTKPK